jgi:acetyl esterase/lipase
MSGGIPAGRDEGESAAERLIAGVTRSLMRMTLRPVVRPGVPVALRRRRMARVSGLSPAPRGAEYRAASCGGVRGQSVTARRAPSAGRAVLYLHGGFYSLGSPATHRVITGHLARRCAARVFAADYRLAPEHPFPAALDDAVAAYGGLLSGGLGPGEIAIAGDSAGGGLAVATAVRLRDLGVPLPAALVLFSPWVDLGLGALEAPPRGEIMVSLGMLSECARFYLAGHPADDPLASPVGANLEGLPPTLIQVGTDELLLTDSRRLHAALVAAGVEAVLHEYARRWHVFQLNAGLLADANRALDEAGAFVRTHAPAVAITR